MLPISRDRKGGPPHAEDPLNLPAAPSDQCPERESHAPTGDTPMTRSTMKFLAVPLAAVTLVGALAMSASDAQAGHWRRHHHHGYGGAAVGAGIAAAIIGTAAIAAAASQPRCDTVPVYNRRGQVIGYRDAC
jgi:hypothetical protein